MFDNSSSSCSFSYHHRRVNGAASSFVYPNKLKIIIIFIVMQAILINALKGKWRLLEKRWDDSHDYSSAILGVKAT